MDGFGLITPRLLLRPPEGLADAAAIAAITDERVARMTTRVPWPNPPSGVLRAFARMREGGESVFVITDRRRGERLGMAGVSARGVGYWLGASARGRGLATEAAEAILIHAFGALRLREARAEVFTGNPASLRVLTRLGFRRVGRSRVHSVGRGGEVGQIELSLSRPAWAAAQRIKLVTPRLVLSPMGPEDAAELARRVDLSASRMTATLPHPLTPQAAAERIAERAFRGAPGFALGVRLDGRLIGEIGLGRIPEEDGAPSLGIWLAEDWRGRGLGREAMQAFAPHVMDRFGLERITAGAFADNAASRAMLARLGFVETGTGRGRSLSRARPSPTIDYALTRADFDMALTRAPAAGRSAA